MPAISFSGLASGIDGDAIIKALIDGQRLASAPLRSKVENTETENTALEEFNTKLLTLNDTLSDFLTLAGGSVAKTAQSSNEEALTATAGSAATASTTTLTVEKLAKAATVSLADTYTDLTAPIAPGLSADTSVQITVGTGATAETFAVPVTSTTTIAQLADSINNGSAGGKVRATLVNIGTEAAPQYKLIVSSTRTGIANGSLEITPSPELTAAGVLQVGNVQQAEDARIHLDAIGTISRSSNQISDLIPGVTINLKAENTGPIVISVSNDADKSAKRLGDMVTAINELIKYSNANSKIERVQNEKGVTNNFGSLARTTVDNRAIESLKRAISDARSGVAGSKVQVFADLGVTTERDGTLKFDADKFTEAVANDPVAVNNVLQGFADNVGATGGLVSEYTKFQGIIESAKSSNQDQMDSINNKLNRVEENLERQTQAMKLRFAALEKRMAELNSSSGSLTALISGGLGTKK